MVSRCFAAADPEAPGPFRQRLESTTSLCRSSAAVDHECLLIQSRSIDCQEVAGSNQG
jgi:hypothetical protein